MVALLLFGCDTITTDCGPFPEMKESRHTLSSTIAWQDPTLALGLWPTGLKFEYEIHRSMLIDSVQFVGSVRSWSHDAPRPEIEMFISGDTVRIHVSTNSRSQELRSTVDCTPAQPYSLFEKLDVYVPQHVVVRELPFSG